jgi:hypothetical protein
MVLTASPATPRRVFPTSPGMGDWTWTSRQRIHSPTLPIGVSDGCTAFSSGCAPRRIDMLS